MKKYIKIGLLILAAIPSVASAATEPITVEDCSLGLYPFNFPLPITIPPTKPKDGTDANPYFKILSGLTLGSKTPGSGATTVSQDECKNRAPYDSSHIQDQTKFSTFYDGLLTDSQLDQQVPKVRHEHFYVNNSKQDSVAYFKSFVYEFEIKLENDARINTQNLECITPVPPSFSGSLDDLKDCDGYVSNLWGGTRVKNFPQGDEIVVRWYFGADSDGKHIYNSDPFSGIGIGFAPVRFGNNQDFNPYFTAKEDLTLQLSPQRTFRPEVVMVSKDSIDQKYWSATTTSRALIRNYQVAKSLFNSSFDQSQFRLFLNTSCSALDQIAQGWCPEKVDTSKYTEQTITLADGTTRGRLFWQPGGTVVSVWQKKLTPPPSALACADLQWDGAFLKKSSLGTFVPATINQNALLPNEAAVMKFKTIYQTGSGTKRPLEYRWVSFSPEASRPDWFKNEDLLFINFGPILTSSLPAQFIKVANAAAVPKLTDISISPKLATDTSGISTALLILGKFRDEIASATNTAKNPLTDDDNQIYYSGGSEGVILGVQAFYTDGLKEKAPLCHLELIVQPAPPTCLSLDVSPSTLKPNTPVEFTVTPHFKPSTATIPLNYEWSANPTPSLIDIGSIDWNKIVLTTIEPDDSPTAPWIDKTILDLFDTTTVIKGIIDPCLDGGCQTKTPIITNPGDLVTQPGFLDAIGTVTDVMDMGATQPALDIQTLGTNVLADYGKKVALTPSTSVTKFQPITTIAPTYTFSPTGEGGYGADPVPYKPATSGSVSGSYNGAVPTFDPGALSGLIDSGVSSGTFSPYPAMVANGGFKDYETAPTAPISPYLETVDKKTWYTGGPGGTTIKVQAKAKDGSIFPTCNGTITIPPEVTGKCDQLKVKFFDGSTEIAKENMVAGKTYTISIDQANSKRTDGTLITKYNILLNNVDGPGAYGSLEPVAAVCPGITGAAGTIGTAEAAPVGCSYKYTSKAGDKIRIIAEPSDGVEACTVEQVIPASPLATCQTIGVTTSPLLSGNLIKADQSVTYTTAPKDTLGNDLIFVIYSETGGGKFVPVTSPANPAICPAVPADSDALVTFTASKLCKYTYQAPKYPTGLEKVSLQVKDSTNTECRADYKVERKLPPTCQTIGVTTNPLLTGNIIKPAQSVVFTADPKDTDGGALDTIVYTETGKGTFISDGGAGCPAVPADSDAPVTFTAPKACKYAYKAPTNPTGTEKVSLRVQGYDNAACASNYTLERKPETPICKSLNLTTIPSFPGNEFGLGDKINLFTDPRDTDNNLLNPVVYTEESEGHFEAASGNAVSCPAVPADSSSKITFEAPASCHYSFQASTTLPSSGKEHFSVKVKQDNDVDLCTENFELKLKPKPPEEKCLALNLKVNGLSTLNPSIVPGQSYALQVQPMTTLGNLISMVEWTENGPGKLVGEPSNPGICPATINDGAVTTLSVCRYLYISPATATEAGFAVRAVPSDSNSNCEATAKGFKPPVTTPYCLYLDLDTSGTFNPLSSNNMNATVVMSDGSKYLDNVRFKSTNGAGQFTGGYTSTSGNGSSDFKTNTDGTNNTGNVNYSSGDENSGINVFLADTSVIKTAACQRQLLPTPTKKPPEECTEPPVIKRKPSSNTYCAEEGKGSDSYCWSIKGVSNPLFTTGSNKATGNCVTLDGDIKNFELTVEDCNPKYRDICYDNLDREDTPKIPKIEKRISKSAGSFGTKINYSTKGSSASAATVETVKYQLKYYPYNYSEGNMTVSIHDPAFSGIIYGNKPITDKDGNVISNKGGTININLSSIKVQAKDASYPVCSGSYTPLSKCFEPPKPTTSGMGVLTIHGIESTETITITYDGQLNSSITTKECKEGIACNERFINQSFVTDMKYCREETDSEGKKTYPCTSETKPADYTCKEFKIYDKDGKEVTINPCKEYSVTSNQTSAELVCQYFLTRASGDVFLEDELVYGVDVSKCYPPFKNVSSTITKPATPITGKLASTGGGVKPQVITINHEICSAGQNRFDNLNDLTPVQKEALKKIYGADISKLSSQICEVGLVPGSDWDKESIAASIEQNVGKLTRWEDIFNPGSTIMNSTDISKEGKVYYYHGTGSGDKVTIGNSTSSLVIPEGSGALTIIVDNADLVIENDITYGGGTAETADKIASLGVIVIDGNIQISNNVKTLVGAYFVQRTDPKDASKGNIYSKEKVDTDKQLTVYGSVYGNIGPLMEYRTGSGDVAKDEGSFTIRYDQRIIQNPPAALAELLGSYSQGQIAQ